MNLSATLSEVLPPLTDSTVPPLEGKLEVLYLVRKGECGEPSTSRDERSLAKRAGADRLDPVCSV
jgi:hypothetical protein